MFDRVRSRFSAKLILLIGLVFIIPVATSLVTVHLTSKASLARFDQVLSQSEREKNGLIKEIFPRAVPQEIADPHGALLLLKDYENRRTFGLFMSLVVISLALAGIVILLSMLILKRGMLSLHELAGAAKRIGEGDFAVGLKARSRDEFAELVAAFRMMGERLKETTVSRDFLNGAIESMPAAVFTIDDSGRVTTWNRQAALLTGIGALAAVGCDVKEFSDVIGPPLSDLEIPSVGREAVVRPRNGGEKIVSRGADYLTGGDGRRDSVIVTFVDITAQKELERDLVIAKERAEESSRLRSEFLANMSHEIRTPLNGILGLAEVMAEDESDAEKKSNLESIRQCGRNLLHLINEILELSKLEARKLILHPAIVPIADVIREATATISVECKRKGIALKVEIAGDVPKVIEADSHKLVRVLVNLLGNALKFTERGFINLRAANYSGERPGNLIFEVSDTGVGIPRERQQHIFESFVEAEEYMKRSGAGTGLGLAISRKLVTLMGGDIWLSSEPREGSVFSFTIKAC